MARRSNVVVTIGWELVSFFVFLVRFKRLVNPKGNSIAIVGGAPERGLNDGTGRRNKKYDVVIILNFADKYCPTNLVAKKKTIRWIGATMDERHEKLLGELHQDHIISTKKNTEILERVGCGAIYYGVRVFSRLPNLYFQKGRRRVRVGRSPFRTGTNVLFFMWFSGARDVSIFRFSSNSDGAETVMASANPGYSQEFLEKHLTQKHGDLGVEKAAESRLLEEQGWRICRESQGPL